MKIYNTNQFEKLNINPIKINNLSSTAKTVVCYVVWPINVKDADEIIKTYGNHLDYAKLSNHGFDTETVIFFDKKQFDNIYDVSQFAYELLSDSVIFKSFTDISTTKRYLFTLDTSYLADIVDGKIKDNYLTYIQPGSLLEKININPINMNDLESVETDIGIDKRINNFLENPKYSLITNDIVKIDGNFYWVFAGRDIEQYSEHYNSIDYEDGVFYYTEVTRNNQLQPSNMSFAAYDDNLKYIAGWASEEEFTIHEVYLYIGPDFSVKKLEVLKQDHLKRAVLSKNNYIKIEI